jgi:RNA polymerase sigma-70 factor (ECF subfamily)
VAAEQDSDLALLEAWTTGDEAAGNQLLKRHFRTLFRFFRNKVSDSVDDLVQQTMMACAESVHRFRGESSFRTYLLAIARGQLLMHLRRYARKGKPIDQLETSVAALLDSPSSILAAKDEHEVLAAALRNIPLELQMTLELYYWEDLSTNEIGTIMEIPPGTVKSRLHRGRRLVKEWIEKQAELQPGLRAVTMQTVEAWRE